MNSSTRFILAVVVAASTTLPVAASAQDRAVVSRVAEFGQMPARTARQFVRTVDQRLAADAREGGETYNDLRQQVNQALFGDSAGPGATREEFSNRLRQVTQRMNRGMNEAVLEVLFQPGQNAAVLCAHRWGLTMGACDALIAASTRQAVAFPYLAPDDGRALSDALRQDRGTRRHAREIVQKLRETMLGVPGNLANNAQGRRLLVLLQSCPGGLDDRPAQIRAWHVGPTEGLARCIGSTGGARASNELFGMSEPAARAFAAWAGASENAETQNIQASQTTQPQNAQRQNRNTRNGRNNRRNNGSPNVVQMSDVQALRNQGAAFARAGRYDNAARAYRSALQADDTHVSTLVAYGNVELARRNQAAAVEAFRAAVAIDGSDANYVSLGRGLAQAGQREEAIEALRTAMEINYDNWDARQGLDALGGEVPPPPLPERPSRDTVIGVMQPLVGAVADCDTRFSGRVVFNITVWGRTGEVLEVRSEGEMSEDARFCMEAVVQSANFPRFVQEEFTVAYPYQLEATDE